jgi:hypothetical protein
MQAVDVRARLRISGVKKAKKYKKGQKEKRNGWDH